jgi:SAM-dependent methyltransferase
VQARPNRYALRNDAPGEAARLESLEDLHDASTIRQLVGLGMGPGWNCAELGAGAGSIARWMADTVGEAGHVTVIDQDVSLLDDLGARPNVTVVQGDLTTMSFGVSRFDLVHSRSVLMHVEDPGSVVERVVPSVRPGGAVLFEEVDGAPGRAAARADLPQPFVDVLLPLAATWTWAGGLAKDLEDLGMSDIRDDVRDAPLIGGSPTAAFWAQTLRTIRPLVTDAARMQSIGRRPVDDRTFDAMIALLEDSSLEVPFTSRHRVSARRPAASVSTAEGPS